MFRLVRSRLPPPNTATLAGGNEPRLQAFAILAGVWRHSFVTENGVVARSFVSRQQIGVLIFRNAMQRLTADVAWEQRLATLPIDIRRALRTDG